MNVISTRKDHRTTRLAIGIAANVAALALIVSDAANHVLRVI